ncbi:MAG: High-affinity branched-chain amino acid transport system permease protein LivH, partial [uncultured Thermomicrobiales bacterium]
AEPGAGHLQRARARLDLRPDGDGVHARLRGPPLPESGPRGPVHAGRLRRLARRRAVGARRDAGHRRGLRRRRLRRRRLVPGRVPPHDRAARLGHHDHHRQPRPRHRDRERDLDRLRAAQQVDPPAARGGLQGRRLAARPVPATADARRLARHPPPHGSLPDPFPARACDPRSRPEPGRCLPGRDPSPPRLRDRDGDQRRADRGRRGAAQRRLLPEPRGRVGDGSEGADRHHLRRPRQHRGHPLRRLRDRAPRVLRLDVPGCPLGAAGPLRLPDRGAHRPARRDRRPGGGGAGM